MSAEFKPPLEQANPALLDQLRQFTADARTGMGRAAAAGLLVLVGGAATFAVESMTTPTVASADAIADALAAYPDKNDACEPADVISPPQTPTASSPYVSCLYYNWGVETASGGFSLNSTRGYGYRNCTDWVAWRVSDLSSGSITVPKGLGDAKDWYANSPTSEQKSTPAAGDIAVSTSGTYGHVALVESVSADGTQMTVSEYNHDENGGPDQRSMNVAGSEFTEFIDLGVQIPTATPTPTPSPTPTIQGVQHIYSGTVDGRLYETYWGGGNALTTGELADDGAPVTAITEQTTSDGVNHVYSGTDTGAIYETYWGGGNSLTTWQVANVGAAVTSLSSLETADGVEHVYSGTASDTINETYWGPGNSLTTWQVANIGTPVTGIASDMTPADGVEHVFTSGADGSLHESYWGGGNSLTTWQITNPDGSEVDGITGRLS